MNLLVSDFLINPVLRQARRFSGSNNSALQVDEVAVQTPLLGRYEIATENIAERMEGSNGSDAGGYRASESISLRPLSSSPIEDDGRLESELRTLQDGRPPSAAAALDTSPLRLTSLLSDPGQTDDNMSENPSGSIRGFLSRSESNSTTSTTFNITGPRDINARMSPAEGPSRRTTQDFSQSVSANRHRNSSLPADDGMGALRQQIILIQAMEVPADQKAHMMHKLLTQGYNQAQEMYHTKQQPQVPSPLGMVSQERPATSGSLSSFIWQINGTSDNAPSNQQHTFHLSPDDLIPTYAPVEPQEPDEEGEGRAGEEEQVLGCRHYKRNVKLQCSTCDRWYTCRLCHNEVEDHVLIRQATRNMLCMLCGCAQGAGEFCVACGERTAWYYCGVCKLWDNDANKSIYHCNDCGICRKGRGLGKDFFHCKTCGVCMTMSVEHSHKCIERVSDCDCPICGEYMFTSPQPVVFMLCGHSIHQTCYYEHMKTSYKCPICSKSTVNMETQFRNLDRAIDAQPMPPKFQDTKAMVSCNDCYAKSAVKYHWLGLKCAICDSYNTAQLSILSDPAVDVPTTENRDTEDAIVPDQVVGEISSLATVGPGPVRHRRYSSHVRPAPTSLGVSSRLSPYPIPLRTARSLSPVRGLGFFNEAVSTSAVETDESGDENDLDFWGRDEPRSVTSLENIEVDMEQDEESAEDSASAMDDCEDDDGDEVDRFELFGHR